MLRDRFLVAPCFCWDELLCFRQVLSNLVLAQYSELMDAYKLRDSAKVNATGDAILKVRMMLGRVSFERTCFLGVCVVGVVATFSAVELSAKQIIVDMDGLMATDSHYSLKHWLESARSWGNSTEAKNYFEWNARNQVTLWGDSGEISALPIVSRVHFFVE